MHHKTTAWALIGHFLFSLLCISFIFGIGFAFGMGIAIFPPFAYFGCAAVAFILHGLVFRALNHMPYLSIKAFVLGILLPMIAICVAGSLAIYFLFKVDDPSKLSPDIIMIPCLGISFIAWLIAYLAHTGKCPRCGARGVCIYTGSSALTGKDYDYGAETHIGTVGTYTVEYSDGSSESGSIQGETVSATVTENRNYVHKYTCRFCGYHYENETRLEGVNWLRKIKDAIQHDERVD